MNAHAEPRPLALVGCFVVPADHPCLPGHFPGHALVPGVLLLEEALTLILGCISGTTLAGIIAAKFTAMVRPGSAVEVRCTPPALGRVAFTCIVDDRTVARGSIRLDEAGS